MRARDRRESECCSVMGQIPYRIKEGLPVTRPQSPRRQEWPASQLSRHFAGPNSRIVAHSECIVGSVVASGS